MATTRVAVWDGAYLNTIKGNVISGNTLDGIDVQTATTYGIIIQGNNIGTTADGKGALGNGSDGHPDQ